MQIDMKQVMEKIEKGMENVRYHNARTIILCNRINLIAKEIRNSKRWNTNDGLD